MTPSEKRLAKLRKAQGLRKSQPLVTASERSGEIAKGVIIPDINHGAWSLVGQPPAPDFVERKFDFL